jgi:hypothetical protein
MTTSIESFVADLGTSGNKDTIGKALKNFYNNKLPDLTEKDYLPVVIFKTHVSTIINGIAKSISVSDFKNILHNLSGGEEDKVPPISLPFGCFMFNRSGDTLFLNCYYRGSVIDVTFQDRDSKKVVFNIPIPNIIISFTLKKIGDATWQVTHIKYFSTPKSVSQLPDDTFISGLDPEIGVHRLPFPNMYGDGRMCYGGNTMPVRFNNNLRGLDYYYQVLTQSPFNSDLGLLGLTMRYTPRNWFEFLNGKKEFPYELLSKLIND